jgi:hypothetical protein
MKVLEKEDMVFEILMKENFVDSEDRLIDMTAEIEFREEDGEIKAYIFGWIQITEDETWSYMIDLNKNTVISYDLFI